MVDELRITIPVAKLKEIHNILCDLICPTVIYQEDRLAMAECVIRANKDSAIKAKGILEDILHS